MVLKWIALLLIGAGAIATGVGVWMSSRRTHHFEPMCSLNYEIKYGTGPAIEWHKSWLRACVNKPGDYRPGIEKNIHPYTCDELKQNLKACEDGKTVGG